MKTIDVTIIKKNKVYLAAKNNSSYDVKIKIDDLSTHLLPGDHTLLVEDISVRSKYGTDLIYKVVSETKNNEIITLKHRYNSNLVDRCRELGGRFDSTEKAWIFSSIVAKEVEDLEELYNSEEVEIEITALDDNFSYQSSLKFEGYPLAQARDRDSGAMICDDAYLIYGHVTSSGSRKNWGTECLKGTIFRLKISKILLEVINHKLQETKEDERKWSIQKINKD